MRIGELARRTGTTPKAIRLYEARGLMGAVARAGSYRHYGEADVARVLLIRQAQALGFRLSELDGLPHIDTAAGWERMAQLVAQRDTVSDERRNGLAMAAIGAVATLLTIRRPFGILGMIAAVAGTATVWGIIQFLGAQRNLNTLNEHLAKLTEERKEYEALLEE